MKVNTYAKRLVKRIFSKLGFEIKRSSPEHLELRTTLGQAYSLLRRLGADPNTVIDVGVAGDTEELYTKFPKAYFLLIEPLPVFEDDMIAILNKYRGSYVLAAAGAMKGQMEFNVHDHSLEGSSLYKETMGEEADGHMISVPMIRVDDILRERNLKGPFIIKIDVQGAELDVLEGCEQALHCTEAVVLEVALFETMKGAPQFYDVISYMYDRGFVAYDIILGWNRPLDGALGQVDIVFVKKLSHFRKDHSYAANPSTQT